MINDYTGTILSERRALPVAKQGTIFSMQSEKGKAKHFRNKTRRSNEGTLKKRQWGHILGTQLIWLLLSVFNIYFHFINYCDSKIWYTIFFYCIRYLRVRWQFFYNIYIWLVTQKVIKSKLTVIDSSVLRNVYQNNEQFHISRPFWTN